MQPREKLARFGVRALENAELVALLLGTGTRGKPVMQLAAELTSKGLAPLERSSLSELVKLRGLGRARASGLLAGLELGRRLWAEPGRSISVPEEAVQWLREMVDLRKEHFRALYLDARRRLMHCEVVSIGTLTASLVHPREVFQPAVELGAAAMVVAHNHPSGDPTPSSDDLVLTRRLRKAGEILGVELLDHIIIARRGFVSLRQRGDL